MGRAAHASRSGELCRSMCPAIGTGPDLTRSRAVGREAMTARQAKSPHRISMASNTPSSGAEQPNIEAESRHTPAQIGGNSAGGEPGQAKPEPPAPGDFGRPGSKGPQIERGPDPISDKPAGGWELNFVISGRVRWSFVGPEATHDTFEGEKGDLVFAPQGHFHYFENASDTEELVVLIIFNSGAGEPDDDVGYRRVAQRHSARGARRCFQDFARSLQEPAAQDRARDDHAQAYVAGAPRS